MQVGSVSAQQIANCPHVSGRELVCYWECNPETGAQNRHVLICEICGGRFELQIPKVELNDCEAGIASSAMFQED
jgi:transcription elongation factor Elf1